MHLHKTSSFPYLPSIHHQIEVWRMHALYQIKRHLKLKASANVALITIITSSATRERLLIIYHFPFKARMQRAKCIKCKKRSAAFKQSSFTII